MRLLLTIHLLLAPAWAAESTKWLVYNKQVDKCSKEAHRLNGEGIRQFGEKNYDQAIVTFTRSLGLCRSNPTALSNRGAIYSQMGKHDAAIADTEAALKSLSKQPDGQALIKAALATLYVERAKSLVGKGALNSAMTDLRKAIKYDVKNAPAYAEMAYLATHTRKYKDCVELATMAIEADASNSEGYANRGSCLSAMGKLKEALTDINKAIALSPRAESYLNRAGVLAAEGNCTKAKEDAARAVQMVPTMQSLVGQILAPCIDSKK